MPFAVLLGFAIALLNFVLIIGPILVIAATAVLSLATFNDWELILAAPGIVLVLHLIESQFVSPWLIGNRLEISPFAVFSAIALLGWMWGAVGAMVAVPILILLYTFGKHIPALSPLAAMIGPTEGLEEDEEKDEKKPKGEPAGGAVPGEVDRIETAETPQNLPDPDKDAEKKPLPGVLPSPLG
jgi:predicted PurR-regulated permease PerM